MKKSTSLFLSLSYLKKCSLMNAYTNSSTSMVLLLSVSANLKMSSIVCSFAMFNQDFMNFLNSWLLIYLLLILRIRWLNILREVRQHYFSSESNRGMSIRSLTSNFDFPLNRPQYRSIKLCANSNSSMNPLRLRSKTSKDALSFCIL